MDRFERSGPLASHRPPAPSIATPPVVPATAPAKPGEIVVATYNVENLFDCTKDEGKQDADFMPDGHYRWTEEKLTKKLENLGRAIRAINAGKGPDVLALEEVENAGVLARLRDDALADLGYQTVIHLEGEDRRGIDNAILSRFPMIGEPKLHSVHGGKAAPWYDQKTRGILEATLDTGAAPLTVFVNHWPAGPEANRAKQREEVAAKLRAVIEAKLAADPDAEIIVLGDFNADPDAKALGSEHLGGASDPAKVRERKPGAGLLNTIAIMAAQVAPPSDGAGHRDLSTIRELLDSHGPALGTHFDQPEWSPTKKGRWNLFDQILVSPGLLDDKGLSWVPGSTQRLKESFLFRDNGEPLGTFEPKVEMKDQKVEKIGASDHLPLVTRLRRAPS